MYSVQPKFYCARGAGVPTPKMPHGISSDLGMTQSHIAIAPLDHLTPLKLTNLGVLIPSRVTQRSHQLRIPRLPPVCLFTFVLCRDSFPFMVWWEYHIPLTTWSSPQEKENQSHTRHSTLISLGLVFHQPPSDLQYYWFANVRSSPRERAKSYIRAESLGLSLFCNSNETLRNLFNISFLPINEHTNVPALFEGF